MFVLFADSVMGMHGRRLKNRGVIVPLSPLEQSGIQQCTSAVQDGIIH